jgi:hypothetical protein
MKHRMSLHVRKSRWRLDRRHLAGIRRKPPHADLKLGRVVISELARENAGKG